MIKRNDPFICKNCKKSVKSARFGKIRNHCSFCLYSLHIDINPGDRKHPCKGLMKPVKIELRGKQKYVLHRCLKCGIEKWNKLLEDDKINFIN